MVPPPAAVGSTPAYYPGPDKKDNKAAARDKKDPSGLGLYPGWSFAWPVNRRIIYNRCSVDAQGQPWNPQKALVRWDGAANKWVRNDVPDFKWIDPATKTEFPPAESLKAPYLMLPEGKARLFVPKGLCKEGPYPVHYEALECPFINPVYPNQQGNPVIRIWKSELDKYAEICDPKYPIYRHYLPGYGALAGRGPDPQPALAGSVDPGDVRGDQPFPGPGQGHQSRRLGQGFQRPGFGAGPGPGHPSGASPLSAVCRE